MWRGPSDDSPSALDAVAASPEDVPASRDDFEFVGVFNPGAVRADETLKQFACPALLSSASQPKS
jgi:hypothetical protein